MTELLLLGLMRSHPAIPARTEQYLDVCFSVFYNFWNMSCINWSSRFAGFQICCVINMKVVVKPVGICVVHFKFNIICNSTKPASQYVDVQ